MDKSKHLIGRGSQNDRLLSFKQSIVNLAAFVNKEIMRQVAQ